MVEIRISRLLKKEESRGIDDLLNETDVLHPCDPCEYFCKIENISVCRLYFTSGGLTHVRSKKYLYKEK